MPALHEVLAYLGIALAVSFDGLAVGAAYSVKGTRLPAVSLTYVSLATAALVSLSMKMGALLSGWVSPWEAQFWGGVIILALGVWQAWQGCVEVLDERLGARLTAASTPSDPVLLLRFRSFGLIIQILKEPLAADRDSSGVIDPRESVLLGIALGLDAFAAGFGASLTGFSWPLIPLVAVACPAFLLLGSFVVRVVRTTGALRKCYTLPGIILMAIGLMKVTGRF